MYNPFENHGEGQGPSIEEILGGRIASRIGRFVDLVNDPEFQQDLKAAFGAVIKVVTRVQATADDFDIMVPDFGAAGYDGPHDGDFEMSNGPGDCDCGCEG